VQQLLALFAVELASLTLEYRLIRIALLTTTTGFV